MPTIGRHHHGSARGQYPALCAYCGVPWPRSKMRKDGAGRLMCPDDFGRSATELDRDNARAARYRREPLPAPDLYVAPAVTSPETILGDILHSWFKPELDYVDALPTDRPSVRKLYNRGDDGDLVQTALPNQRPIFVHDRGHGALTGWGRMTMTHATQLTSGTRPYFWIVASGQAGTTTKFLLSLFGGLTSTIFTRNTSGNYQCHMRCSDGVETIDSGLAVDGTMRLLECGFLSTTAARFRVDGTAYNGSFTGGLNATSTSLGLGDSDSDAWAGSVFEFAIATEAPTAAQLTAMRDYFADTYSELDIA